MMSGAVRSRGYWVLLLALAFLPGGCKKDWLDAKTNKNLVVPASLSDFQALLDNTDIMNAYSCGIGEIGSDGHTVMPSRWLRESGQEYNAYTWRHDYPVTNSLDWNTPYRRVAYCNLVLEGLDKINPDNDSDRDWWKALKGNALFQRGRSFFELAQVYAPAYTTATIPGNWGIPLRLSSDINIPSVRSTVQDTYNQVIADLMAAKDLLPLVPLYKTRPSKPAALALLSRVYLAMEVYGVAFTYADSCLQLTNRLLDYNMLYDTAPVPRFNDEVIFHSTLVNWGNINSDALVDSSLYALYDAADRRKTVYFNTSSGIVFKGSYYGGTLLFSGLATDELYLTRAECNARMGNTAKAMQDVNTLLKKRYKSGFAELTAADAKDALSKILLERRKELLLRGLRWTDLRRLNHDPAYAVTISHAVPGKNYTLAPDSDHYTFPIPDDIIQLSGMTQNPGW